MSILFFFILIPPILYFQFYFRRIILCFYPHPNIFIRLFSWIFALLFVLPAYNLFRFWAVVVYHLFAFALICDLVMWILHQRKVHNILLNKIYHLGVIPLLCLAILLGYAYYHMQDVQTVHYTVTTSKSLSKDYTIAFISPAKINRCPILYSLIIRKIIFIRSNFLVRDQCLASAQPVIALLLPDSEKKIQDLHNRHR